MCWDLTLTKDSGAKTSSGGGIGALGTTGITAQVDALVGLGRPGDTVMVS